MGSSGALLADHSHGHHGDGHVLVGTQPTRGGARGAGRYAKSEIKGKEARHYPDTDTVEIDQPIIYNYSKDGRKMVANAARALTNADGSELQLFDKAVVVRDGQDKDDASTRTEVRSDFLHVFMNTEEIRTHLPVELRRGDKDRFFADKMHYNNLSSTMDLKGRVRGVIAPRSKP